MINSDKIKDFWDKRAYKLKEVEFESIANLEEDNKNLTLKIKDECEKVFNWLPQIKDLKILDLGAGVGQWAFRFAQKKAKYILAVERSKGLVEIGEMKKKDLKLNNIDFENSPAETFTSNETFDLVFISGLFVYLNNSQYKKILNNLHDLVSENGLLMIRDGMSIQKEQYEINDQYSEHLNAFYSAIYRKRNNYIQSIENQGFKLIKDENMFPEGHVLNKYPQTRLHLFLFKKI